MLCMQLEIRSLNPPHQFAPLSDDLYNSVRFSLIPEFLLLCRGLRLAGSDSFLPRLSGKCRINKITDSLPNS